MNGTKDRGFTLIELLIVVAIISIIAAIAVPGLLKMRQSGNETSAFASVNAIRTAEAAYSSTCGNYAYAVKLTTLGTPTPGTTEAYLGAPLGASDTPQKDGYNFTLTGGAGAGPAPNDCNGTATQTTYYASGVPMTFGTTGGKSYAVN